MKARPHRVAIVTSILICFGLPIASCGSNIDDELLESSAHSAGQTVTIHSDEPHYETLSDAWGAADVVVTATFVGSSEGVLLGTRRLMQPYSDLDETVEYDGRELTMAEYMEVAGSPVTVSRVQITDVLKGEVSSGEVIEVQQSGGKIGDLQFVEDGATLIADLRSKDVLLFLAKVPEDFLVPINSAAGTWKAQDGGFANASQSGRTLYGGLTRADLKDLAGNG